MKMIDLKIKGKPVKAPATATKLSKVQDLVALLKENLHA